MTYQRVLVGTDGSEFAQDAEQVAVALARSCKASLVIAHVRHGGEVASVLERAEAAALAEGVEAESTVGDGDPGDVLIDLAQERGADVIVLGSRGLSRGQQILGSVSHRVAYHAPCDVILVAERRNRRPPQDGPYRRVLIGTDGSSTADRASRKGTQLADQIGAQITLAFVGHPKTGEMILADTAKTLGHQDDATLRVLAGDPAEAIMELAREEGHDLIVVGNKGLTGAKSFLLGSVPRKVSEYAPCDVLIARTVTQALTELRKGEGGIVTSGDRKVAAYRDEAGEVHAMSARCTHMGCIVGWNSADRTWDCPCHGSRYAPTGEVVHGPAKKALEATDL